MCNKNEKQREQQSSGTGIAEERFDQWSMTLLWHSYILSRGRDSILKVGGLSRMLGCLDAWGGHFEREYYNFSEYSDSPIIWGGGGGGSSPPAPPPPPPDSLPLLQSRFLHNSQRSTSTATADVTATLTGTAKFFRRYRRWGKL